ncbi:hypothetical protein M501DRAFT_985803 [Patellaria atrata CBS 101060]|uniref:Uncharacterized protein n=1 Tax=Patellaria atrata CBS 101060 TaxID=1346257 RepID=A0A9P4SIR7_9PEZI|nr:hypothetical protein M501DRAFT_985803 [Patellaria atrata CBS 101060]
MFSVFDCSKSIGRFEEICAHPQFSKGIREAIFSGLRHKKKYCGTLTEYDELCKKHQSLRGISNRILAESHCPFRRKGCVRDTRHRNCTHHFDFLTDRYRDQREVLRKQYLLRALKKAFSTLTDLTTLTFLNEAEDTHPALNITREFRRYVHSRIEMLGQSNKLSYFKLPWRKLEAGTWTDLRSLTLKKIKLESVPLSKFLVAHAGTLHVKDTWTDWSDIFPWGDIVEVQDLRIGEHDFTGPYDIGQWVRETMRLRKLGYVIPNFTS